MKTVEPIKITGLKQFQAALKQLDGESQKQLRVTLNTVAETVAAGAARRVPTKTGRAKASLKAKSSQREARVSGGASKAPYYGWLDFGGRVGRDRSASRKFVKSGRYMYPAFAANRDSIYKALAQALADLARRSGLQVTDDG